MGDNLSISETRQALNALPELLAREHETITVTRRGKPVLAIMPWELYEAIIETLEIAGDEKLMKALRRSMKQANDGELIPWEDIKAEI